MYRSKWCKAYSVSVAFGGALWWMLLVSSATIRSYFVWPGLSERVLFAFLPADILFIILIPLAWSVRPSVFLWNAHRFATHYATLVTCALCVYTKGAWAGAILMLIASIGAELVAGPVHLPDHVQEAPRRGPAINAIKTLSQTAIRWLVFLVFLPYAVHQVELSIDSPLLPHIDPLIPWSLFWVAGLTGIYCGMLFAVYGEGTPLPLDATTRFVVIGPYRATRNPMASTGVFQGFMVALHLQSPFVLLYCVIGALLWHFFARPWEEADLLSRFGEHYARYRDSVPNWLIRFPLYPKITLGKREIEKNHLEISGADGRSIAAKR